jgi:hypothetical protein
LSDPVALPMERAGYVVGEWQDDSRFSHDGAAIWWARPSS